MLLMALSGSAETPDLGHRGGGCCGGYVAYDCGGGCCGGYSYGCCGGGSSCHGGGHHRGGHSRHNRGHGCCGGGYSYGCCGGGCWGSCYGGYGGCCGGYGGCTGGCTGGVYMGGCYGGCYGGCTGGVYMGGGMMMMPSSGKAPEMAPPPKEGKGKEISAPATLVVTLPADAKLTIDDAPTTSTSEVRTFVTPELKPQKEFVYTLKAQITRDGQAMTAVEKVSVKAGQETRVSLEPTRFAAATVAQK
jgi:uncharacterized protein (TIGR03000 family)